MVYVLILLLCWSSFLFVSLSVSVRYDRGVTAADDGAVERDSDSEGGEEEELWGEPGDEEEEEEIMHQREEELEAELNLATKRCQELKETLQVTKSFIEGKAIKGADAGRAKIDSSIPSDEEDDLEEATEMEEYEDEPGVGLLYSSPSLSFVLSCQICMDRIPGKSNPRGARGAVSKLPRVVLASEGKKPIM
jgi:hypothetical protein